MAKEYVEERNGGFYVAGTSVSLDSIVVCYNEGMSAETIHGEFDTLKLAQANNWYQKNLVGQRASWNAPHKRNGTKSFWSSRQKHTSKTCRPQ